jgi:hypothetical protein
LIVVWSADLVTSLGNVLVAAPEIRADIDDDRDGLPILIIDDIRDRTDLVGVRVVDGLAVHRHHRVRAAGVGRVRAAGICRVRAAGVCQCDVHVTCRLRELESSSMQVVASPSCGRAPRISAP